MLKWIIAILIITTGIIQPTHAQTTGSMKVVKPAHQFVCTVVDSIRLEGLYYVLSQKYIPNNDRFHCQDPNFPNGNFLALYDSAYAFGKGGAEIAYTFSLKNNVVVGEYKYFTTTGQLQTLELYDDGQLLRSKNYCDAWLCSEIVYDSLGRCKKYHYYQNGTKKRDIIYRFDIDSTGYLNSIILSALEYDTKGLLLYKYNCQTLTRVTLNADGSVLKVTAIPNCNFDPRY